MAQFKVQNKDLLNFSKFNHMIVNEFGIIGFDYEDYKTIVGQGTTEYFFASSHSIEEAFEIMKTQISPNVHATQMLCVFEVPSDTPTMDPAVEMMDQLCNMINPEIQPWINCYILEEQNHSIHERMPRIHLLVND